VGERGAGPPANRTDIVLLAVVAIVIVGALLFRQSDGTERAARTPVRQAPRVAQQPGVARFFIPQKAKEDVKRDLRELLPLQEMFFADSAHYAKDVSQINGGRPWNPTSKTKITIVWADARGWAATATSDWLGGATCVIRLGAVPESVRPRTHFQQREGHDAEPACDGDL
jgi:hypothetical protein